MTADPAKTTLRAELKTLRDEVSARDPDAAETLAAKFPMKLLERYGPVVGGYWPIGSEMDPRPVMQKLEAAGAKLALPRINEDNAMSFRQWQVGDDLDKGPFGLSEPHQDAPHIEPTLILLPLLGFDKLGTRLGYGKGFYDRMLTGLRTQGRVFACGLGFHAQMLDELPAEPHDQPLDWAVTERGSVPIFMMRTFAREEDTGNDDGPGAA